MATAAATTMAPRGTDSPAQLNLVQALRGAAAVGVLTHHIATSIDLYFGPGWTPPGTGLGWVGVDLFFVLSGFIMVWTTRNTKPGPRATVAFWTRRALRVYPPYWAALVMLVIMTTALPALAPHTSGAGIWQSIMLLPADEDPYLNPGWTLIYELWFYLVFGLLLLAPKKWLGPLLGVWALAIIGGALHFGMDTGPVLHVIVNPLSLNFLMGAAVALVMSPQQEGIANPRIAAFAAAAAAFGLLAGAWYVTETGWNEWTRMLACGPASALLVAAAVHADQHGMLRPPATLVRLGDWSYALYLTHQPLVFAITIVCAATFGHDSLSAVGIAIVLGLTIPFVATAVLHQFVERPAQSLGRNLARKIEAK